MVAAAERPGLRLMRIVGSQYDATDGVEAMVAKAEAKVKVRETAVSMHREFLFLSVHLKVLDVVLVFYPAGGLVS